MAKQTDLYLTNLLKNASVTILPADTTALKTVYTASADDAVVKGLSATLSEAVARNVRLWLTIDAVDYQIAGIPIPASAGDTGAVVAVDLLNATALSFLPLDRNGKRVLPLGAGVILKASVAATVAADTLTITALIEEY